MKKDLNSSQSQSAALILGKALCNLFSEAQLLKSAASGPEFCYEIATSQKIPEEFLDLIDGEVFKLINSEVSFYPMEMMAQNAIELFNHQGQFLKEEVLKDEPRRIVHLVKIGEHYDLVQQEYQDSFDGAIKLTHLISQKKELSKGSYWVTQIYGIAASNKQKLKKRLQGQREIEKVSHQKRGSLLNLFSKFDQDWVFHPKGKLALKNLQAQMNTLFDDFGFQEIHCPNFSEKLFDKVLEHESSKNALPCRIMTWTQNPKLKSNPFLKGLFALSNGTQNNFRVLLEPQQLLEECIYCLKFYSKIIKILGFSYEVDYSCKKKAFSIEKALEECGLQANLLEGNKSDRIAFRLLDKWGRNLVTLSLELEELFDKDLLKGSCSLSLEKLVAWLIEENRGELPESIRPLEVRILPLQGTEKFVQEVSEYFKKNKILVTVDQTKEKLDTKLYRALKEQLPYIAIVGKREAETGKLTLRKGTCKTETWFTKEELLQELRTRK